MKEYKVIKFNSGNLHTEFTEFDNSIIILKINDSTIQFKNVYELISFAGMCKMAYYEFINPSTKSELKMAQYGEYSSQEKIEEKRGK